MEQGEIGFLLRQHGQEIGERREDRETDAPAVAVLRPEQRRLPHDVGRRYVGRELTMHGLGDDEAEVVCEAVRKPLMPVRGGIGMTERGLHPDVAIARTSTGHVGTSSAHRSKVQPLSRSKRAWCQ